MVNTNYNNDDQVFINFRGKDERNGFLSHLKQKLKDGNVNLFTDDNVTGQKLSSLFKHIRNSRIAIVIFSKNYTESRWCLDELVEIKKCIETEKLKAVIPIFYKVKVSSVKKQKGKFGFKFRALKDYLLVEEGIEMNKVNSMMEEWKDALKVVTEIAGLVYNKKTGPELDFVEKVVEKVKEHLPNIAETSKAKQESNMTLFVSQLNINYNQLHVSQSLEALNLYNKSVELLASFSHHLKRNNSDLDHRKQFGPYPFEAIMVDKQFQNLRSIDNIGQGKYRGDTTYLSSLRKCFKICLCLNDTEQQMIQNSYRQ